MRLWFFLAVPLLAYGQGGTVDGKAFNRMTKAGAAGVEIHLALAYDRSPKVRTTKSDATGAFRFENVPEGDYTLVVLFPAGFLTTRLRPFHVGDRGAKVEVPLAPTGSIRGRVLDPQGRPVPRIEVQLFRTYGASGHSMTTDAEGRFSAKAVVPGLYHLRARVASEGAPLPPPSEGERWAWAPTYFPNAVEIGSAESLFIREGSALDGLDIRLRTAPVYRLRGVVEDNEGKPAAGVSVLLLSELGWGKAETQVQSGADGVFEFPSVRAGDWRLEANVKRGDIQWMGAASVAMPRRDYDRARIRVDPPFELQGTIEGDPRIEGGYLIARLDRIDAPQVEINPVTREGDRLRFDKVYPGRYRLDAWVRIPGHYLKSILLGPKDVTGLDVDLTPSSPPVRYVLAPNAARVTGTVENGAGVKVVFISTEQETYVPGQAIVVQVCDDQGRFTVDGLRPGSWHAFAFDTSDNMNTDAIRDLVFRRGLARQAAVHHLREGETANLRLRISPWFE